MFDSLSKAGSHTQVVPSHLFTSPSMWRSGVGFTKAMIPIGSFYDSDRTLFCLSIGRGYVGPWLRQQGLRPAKDKQTNSAFSTFNRWQNVPHSGLHVCRSRTGFPATSIDCQIAKVPAFWTLQVVHPRVSLIFCFWKRETGDWLSKSFVESSFIFQAEVFMLANLTLLQLRSLNSESNIFRLVNFFEYDYSKICRVPASVHHGVVHGQMSRLRFSLKIAAKWWRLFWIHLERDFGWDSATHSRRRARSRSLQIN